MVSSHVSCPIILNQHQEHNNHHSIDSCEDNCSHCSSSHYNQEGDSSSISCNHSNSHHSSVTADQNHHHHSHCSNQSSWQEDMKSGSSICSNYQHLHKAAVEQKKYNNRLEFIHDNAIPTSVTERSITSSNYNNNRKRRRCCFCCVRNNTASKISVFCLFLICVLGAIAAFFCWPRTPRVSMGGGADSLNGAPPDWWAGQRSPIPSQGELPSRPSLRATWQINVTLDNHDNWIPTHIKNLDFVLLDSLTLAKFAWSSTSSMVLQPGTVTPISLTFNVNYQAPDNTDPTFQNLYTACGPLKGDQRPALNVLLKVYFHFYGILSTPIVTATPYTGGILCPVK